MKKRIPLFFLLSLIIVIFSWTSVAFSEGECQIKIAWDPNTEPDLAGYKAYYGTASNTYGAPINMGNVTAYTIKTLSPGTKYYIAITAYDFDSYESKFSNEVSGICSVAGPPAAPLNLRMVVRRMGADVKISFDAVGGATVYKVYVGQTYASVQNKQVVPTIFGNRHSYCFSVASNIVGFFIGVTASNAYGESGFSKIGYHLYGNIIGDFDDGTPYTSAIVNGQDLAVLGSSSVFGQSVIHTDYNCAQEFVLTPATQKEKADFDDSGRLDGKDQSIIGQRWYKTLPP